VCPVHRGRVRLEKCCSFGLKNSLFFCPVHHREVSDAFARTETSRVRASFVASVLMSSDDSSSGCVDQRDDNNECYERLVVIACCIGNVYERSIMRTAIEDRKGELSPFKAVKFLLEAKRFLAEGAHETKVAMPKRLPRHELES